MNKRSHIFTAAIAAIGALWWAFLLPEIRPIDWDARHG